MNLITDTILDHADFTGHPVFTPELCLNRRQRRYPCTACAEICPHGVFPLQSGGNLQWDRCTDCSLCVSACPARALAPSAQTNRQYTQTLQEAAPVRLSCRKEEQRGELHVGCLSSVPWELLAVLALRGELILCMRGCEDCSRQEQRRLLGENLQSLRDFLGEEGFARQVRLIRSGEEIPQVQKAPPSEKAVTRRELFSGIRKTLTRQAAEKVSKRLPFLAEDASDGMWIRRLLAESVRTATATPSEGEQGVRPFALSLPRFNTSCFGCGICEKICPHKAISIRREERGTRLVYMEPWKCSACTLCVKLCPHGGLDALAPVALPHLGKLPLVRVKSLSCAECGTVLLPGTEPPLCRRCAAKRKA